MTTRGGECRVKEKNINGMNDDCVERFEGKVQVQHKRASLPVRSIKHGVRVQSMCQARHVPTCMCSGASFLTLPSGAPCRSSRANTTRFWMKKKDEFYSPSARGRGRASPLPISNFFFAHPERKHDRLKQSGYTNSGLVDTRPPRSREGHKSEPTRTRTRRDETNPKSHTCSGEYQEMQPRI